MATVNKFSFMWLLCLVLLPFLSLCDSSMESIEILKAPFPLSRFASASFEFQVSAGDNGSCTNCNITCKLDNSAASDCRNGKVLYTSLADGNHTFEVCNNGSQGFACAAYYWTVDTIPPTAFVTALSPFTNAQNVSVNITFSEPCTGGGGFTCSSINACNLLVYGDGQLIPSSLVVLQPNLKYSILIGLSSTVQYGRAILVMDKNFCTDSAGNNFSRTSNSTFFIRFDRRKSFVDLRTHVPETLVQLNSITRLVQATNDYDKLKVYLYFSEPIKNLSAEIMNCLNTSQGTLVPIDGDNLGNRRYGFTVANLSMIAIVTINVDSSSITSRYGTPVSPISPVTFLYDSQRPTVRLSTTSRMRTRERIVPVSIKFWKPVFGFNSSFVSIAGGHLLSFHQISRSMYTGEIQADDDVIAINVRENVTADVSGNKNLPSNILQVRHYCIPVVSEVLYAFATASFLVTSFSAGILTVSTASLLSSAAFSSPSSLLANDPTRFLFRSACHIQVFALSRWLAVKLPVQYDELVRGLQWSIPIFNLPWENEGKMQAVMAGTNQTTTSSSSLSKIDVFRVFENLLPLEKNISMAAVSGLPLTAMEYGTYFESQNFKPEAEYVIDHHSDGWRNFTRSMFWLSVIAGSLLLLHAIFLLILKYQNRNPEKPRDSYGALIFPRFEIFLVVLALPCICEASAGLVKGGSTSGIIVGILLLSVVGFILMVIFMFLSIGITLGKLLQYKEVHEEELKFHWYNELVRVTLGPGKRGQWTWNNEGSFVYLIMFGPLFEDLRGPPKYMLSQISGGNSQKRGDSIIASDDETEDAEAPFIQKVFGILRIYYTLLESVKRVTLGILAGAYLNNWSSRTPTILLLSITSFQLFFIILKKPFIKKKVQLVEIISVSCEVGLFATCYILLEKDLSYNEETKVGIFMIILFCVGFFAQMINEWYALYRQIKQLDPVDNSFGTGLKVTFIGILMIFLPKKWTKNLEREFPLKPRSGRETIRFGGSSSESRKSESTTDRSWMKQLRNMARASFNSNSNSNSNNSKDGKGAAPTDPSSSKTKWSEFWGFKSSGGSSSASDGMKSQPRGLYKDLEAIFASK
ncbi:hypothetical protein ACFE04_027276 [Oxalis oulophora]